MLSKKSELEDQKRGQLRDSVEQEYKSQKDQREERRSKSQTQEPVGTEHV